MPSFAQFISTAGLLVVAVTLAVIWLSRRALQANASLPGIKTKFVFIAPPALATRLFSFGVLGLAWVNEWTWRGRYEGLFGGSPRDIVAVQSVYPTTKPCLLIADPVTVKAIGQSHARFPKPYAFFAAEQPFGPNILGSEGAEWRRHRRIANPSFNESNNRLVWDTSIETIVGFFNKWTKEGKNTVTIKDVGEWTEQVALMVFCSAGFGYPVEPDADQDRIPKGRSMSFHAALRSTIDNVPTRAVFPTWMLRLFPRGRHTIQAFDDIEAYILEMIEERQMSASDDRKDLLTNLIRAAQGEEKTNEDGDGACTRFTHQDVIANIFIFLFAGHDTTAHSLAFAMILMAMYPDEQEKLYRNIRSVIPQGHSPTYADISKLAPVLSWIYETLRLYPIVNSFNKEATEDCVLPTSDGRGIAVPKGTQVAPIVIAMHYNPKHWDQPSTFKPDRFLGEYDQNAFLPFSMGARGCIGRRFSEVEQLAILSTLVLEYRVEVKEEPQFSNETVEERRGRILGAVRKSLVLGPNKVPLIFKQREGSMFRGNY